MRILAAIRTALIATIGSAIFAGAAIGTPIEFIYTGTGAGSLGGVNFGSSTFTITEFANTASVQPCGNGSGCLYIDSSLANISISGLGTFTFTSATRTFVNQGSNVVGFSRGGPLGNDLYYAPPNVALATYGLLTSFGPISGTGTLLQWATAVNLTPVTTSGGILVFNSAGSPGASFQAIVGTVPEPATLFLFATGIAGIGLTRRKRSEV